MGLSLWGEKSILGQGEVPDTIYKQTKLVVCCVSLKSICTQNIFVLERIFRITLMWGQTSQASQQVKLSLTLCVATL